MADRHSMKNTVSVCRSILICWFDDGNYNIQIIYVIETITECVWRMLLAVNWGFLRQKI